MEYLTTAAELPYSTCLVSFSFVFFSRVVDDVAEWRFGVGTYEGRKNCSFGFSVTLFVSALSMS